MKWYKAIKETQSRKCTRYDDIPAVLLKELGDKVVTALANKICMSREWHRHYNGLPKKKKAGKEV